VTFPVPTITERDEFDLDRPSVDPLGLAAVSEALSDLLLPAVTNRMRCARLLTAVAVGAVAAGPGTSGDEDGAGLLLAFEWMLLEAFVRHLPDEASRGVPGVRKARTAIARGERLSGRTYLKAPEANGFTGVLLPLAEAIGLVDGTRREGPRAGELVALWEREQQVPRSLRDRLGEEVRRSYREGRCSVSERSPLLKQLAGWLSPVGAGRDERRWLRAAMVGVPEGHHQEIAERFGRRIFRTDPEALAAVERGASDGLRRICRAIRAFEQVATGFDAIVHLCLTLGAPHPLPVSRPVTLEAIARHPRVREVVRVLPRRLPAVGAALAGLGAAETKWQELVADLRDPSEPRSVLDWLLHRHDAVMRERDRPPWFETDGHGLRIGPGAPEPPGADRPSVGFGRPYRLATYSRLLQLR